MSPIEELTALLKYPKPNEFCIPPCIGYCTIQTESQSCKLGLEFENPPSINQNLRPTPLDSVIVEQPKPSLTQRAVLAQKIAQALLYLHSVNWLHKALRGENVLLFPSEEDGELDLTSPWLTSFDYVRRARFNEVTTGIPRDNHAEIYYHPDAQFDGPRLYYRKTFDIYGLGILPTEIVHWKPIVKVMDIENAIEMSPRVTRDVQRRWLSESRLLSDLRAETGEKYADAVKTCILGRDAFDVARVDTETSADTAVKIQRGFNRDVVQLLRELVI